MNNNKIPDLVNLNDSFASFTDFLEKIPQEIHIPFDIKYPNGLILEEIVNGLLKKPQPQEDCQIIINDIGYDSTNEIDSILGIKFKVNKDLEEILQENTQQIFFNFQQQIQNEKESQSSTIIQVQIQELEQVKTQLQQEIINITQQQKNLHNQDIRQSILTELIEQKKNNIRIAQQSINLFNDQLLFRNNIQIYQKFINDLIYGILKLETTLTFRTQRQILSQKLSQGEREKIQYYEIQQLKNQNKKLQQQIEDIQDKISFNLNNYYQLEEQIQKAKQQIQQQLQQIKKQKEDKDDKYKTSSPSQMSQSKSNISDLEILKQQTKKMSVSQQGRNRFKTIFYKR